MAEGYYNYDADLIKSASPSATSGTATYTDPIDLGAISQLGTRTEPFELEVALPATTTTHMPSNTSATWLLQSSNDPTFTSSASTEKSWTRSGGSAGAAVVSRFKPAAGATNRYWRVKCTITATNSAVIGSTVADLKYSLAYVAR